MKNFRLTWLLVGAGWTLVAAGGTVAAAASSAEVPRAETSATPGGEDPVAVEQPRKGTLHVTWNAENQCAMARVMRQRVRHQRNFSLKDYGTRAAAEKAAQAWVRVKIKELPPEIPRKDRMTSRNRSGVVGVWLVPVRIEKADGRRYEYWRWTANWPRCPHTGGVSWYVHQYGDADAFVLAVLARQMETVDRDAVLKRFDAVDGTAEYAEILARRAEGAEAPETVEREEED